MFPLYGGEHHDMFNEQSEVTEQLLLARRMVTTSGTQVIQNTINGSNEMYRGDRRSE